MFFDTVLQHNTSTLLFLKHIFAYKIIAVVMFCDILCQELNCGHILILKTLEYTVDTDRNRKVDNCNHVVNQFICLTSP